ASLALVPYVIFRMVSPAIRKTPHARDMALEKLRRMGSMKRQEWIMCFTFLLLIILWIAGSFIGIKAAVAAMAGLSLLLISGVLRWKEVLEEQSAWNTFIWFATLVTLPS